MKKRWKLTALLLAILFLLSSLSALAAPQLQDAETGSAEQTLKTTRPEGRLRGLRLGRLPYRVLVPTSWAGEKGTGKLMNANDPKTGTRVWAESPGDMPVSLDEMLGQFAANADFSHVFKVTIGQNSFVHYIAKAENLRGFAFKAGNTLVIIKFTPADSEDTTALAEQIIASLEKVKAQKAVKGEALKAADVPEAPKPTAKALNPLPDLPWKDASSWKQIFDLAQAGERYIRVTGTVKRAETEETIAASQEITLKGAGEGATLDGNGLQILKVTAGATALTKLINLKLMNGVMHGEDASGQGGAVYTDGNLSLEACTLTANEADRGGAVYALGDVTLQGSAISGNKSMYDGGGIYSEKGSLVLTDSQINSNTAKNDGGGIYNIQGDVKLTDSEVNSNTASDNGGGIYKKKGSLVLTDSQINNNTAEKDGGGIYSIHGDVKLTDSEVNNNTAENDGGGIFTDSGGIDITSGEVSNNNATTNGGGICSNLGHIQITGGLIDSNTATYGGGIYSYSALLDVKGAQVVNNNAISHGGGIYNIDGQVTVSDGQVIKNNATSNGGGIYNDCGTVAITGGQVNENKASYGGGIYSYSKDVNVTGGQVNSNTAKNKGGGIYNKLDDINITGGQVNNNISADGNGATAINGTVTPPGQMDNNQTAP